MSNRQNIEVQLKPNVDVFQVQKYLNQHSIKANVVSLDTIRVWFNPSKISEKKVIKLIAAATKKPSERRGKANIAHLKNIADSTAA